MIKSYNKDKTYCFVHYHEEKDLLIDVVGYEHITILSRLKDKWQLKVIRPNQAVANRVSNNYNELFEQFNKLKQLQ